MNPRRSFRLIRISFASLILHLSLLPVNSFAEKVSLESLFKVAPLIQKKKRGKSVANKKQTVPIPAEYDTFFSAKNVLQHASDLNGIVRAEERLSLLKIASDSKTLNHETDDLLYALEIKKAERLAKKKSWDLALKAFSRGLNGLSSFKWPYYWDKNSSLALHAICVKKKDDEGCLYLAKKVLDGFPKSASETEPLRELQVHDLFSNSEISTDRLTQSYTEKTEKDEKAFDDVLQAFFSQNENELSKETATFLETYPKSGLRFRAIFLLAELQFRNKNKKLAEANYRTLIDQIPLSFYALVSAERMGILLENQVKKEPIEVDESLFNLNPPEKESLKRAQALIEKGHSEEAEFELDGLTRIKSYSNDFLLYFAKMALKADLNLQSFRAVTELIQRRYVPLLQTEMLEIVFPDRFPKQIEKEAKQNHIDSIWVTALMKQESGFRPQALSSSGALGLMQLMPLTAIETVKDLSLKNLRFPETNIEVGTAYLASLFDQYQGNPVYALAAYNAGPHRVAKWRKDADPNLGMIGFIEAIPFKETREYVMAILRNHYWYQYRRGLTTTSVFESWKP